MNRGSTLFLQFVILLFGLGVLTFLLWEPHVEGVNKNATSLYEIYFDDFFLAYVYLSSLPFFMALYQMIRLLGYAGQNKIFSMAAIKSLRRIKYCALIIIVLIAGAVVILLSDKTEGDDRPPILMIGMIFSFGCVVVATAAAIFERILQNAVDLKSENDLTV
jgi:hypothetical protein